MTERSADPIAGRVAPLMARAWSMPTPDTFTIPAVSVLLDRWLTGRAVVIDPFARHSWRGTITNDLDMACDTDFHWDAEVFLSYMEQQGVRADAVLFDPPYSPRQVAEVYRSVGRVVGQGETQNGRLYRACRDVIARLVKTNGVVISCGWNSGGMGITRGFVLQEVLLVAHGGAHNDTIVTVETKGQRHD